jgi:membrane protease YdiL (CAAX protease family)
LSMPGLSDSNREAAERIPPSGRREQCLELAVFLFLIVPSMLLSFFIVGRMTLSFTFLALETVLRDLGLLGLVLFFVWRNGEPFSMVGCRRTSYSMEAAIGTALFIPIAGALPIVESALHELGLTSPSSPLSALTSAKGVSGILLGALMVFVVAVAEETIFRGYLILRLKAVTGSRAWAVALSAAIFSLGHGYEGSAGVVTVAILGVVLAWVYLWRQSLVAAVAIHFLQDFTGIVLMPLLKQLKLM